MFLKYYTDADAQQIHFWGPQDREGYLDAMLELSSAYLLPRGRDADEELRHLVRGLFDADAR